ncbi:MAG: TRAP transporter large permease subunit [Verrucomicrobiae bacterium]|nr:TRAP transporter large permease subunit [Verrucomicrobiae bacterium]
MIESTATSSTSTPKPARRSHWYRVADLENLLVVVVLGAMTLLPCVAIIGRLLMRKGVPASVPVVQHLVLVVCMLGGAVAARENRLLALSAFRSRLSPKWQDAARSISGAFAAGITVLLCGATIQFVQASRQMGKQLVHGIPLWLVQSTMVIGLVLVAVRLIWHGGRTWRGRLATLVGAALIVLFGVFCPATGSVTPEQLRWPALVVLLLAAVFGAPIFSVLGGAAAILLWSSGEPIASIPTNHYRLTTNPTLPTIPLFTLAGYFLAEGGAARRLVGVFDSLFGTIRGGPAVVTVLVCAFFTSFTGASGVTILALGGLLMPILRGAGYTERTSLGLLTAAGSLGLLFPPCLPPILYSIVASNSTNTSLRMEEMFQGGLVPGLVLVGMSAWWGVFAGPRVKEPGRRFELKPAFAALNQAKWELLLPVVALVALFGGFATPVEAAALTALYAFIAEAVIYRDLRLVKDIPRVMTECGLLVGGVLLILGVALGFTHYLIDAQIPDKAVEWVTGAIKSKYVFLLVVNLFLLVVGCLMDIYSAIVVVVPLLVPIAQAFGIDMIHLGVMFLANLELGYLTPPVGMNLFLSSYRFGKPIGEVARATLPMLGVLFTGVLLVTYVPALTTALPRWMR